MFQGKLLLIGYCFATLSIIVNVISKDQYCALSQYGALLLTFVNQDHPNVVLLATRMLSRLGLQKEIENVSIKVKTVKSILNVLFQTEIENRQYKWTLSITSVDKIRISDVLDSLRILGNKTDIICTLAEDIEKYHCSLMSNLLQWGDVLEKQATNKFLTTIKTHECGTCRLEFIDVLFKDADAFKSQSEWIAAFYEVIKMSSSIVKLNLMDLKLQGLGKVCHDSGIDFVQDVGYLMQPSTDTIARFMKEINQIALDNVNKHLETKRVKISLWLLLNTLMLYLPSQLASALVNSDIPEIIALDMNEMSLIEDKNDMQEVGVFSF